MGLASAVYGTWQTVNDQQYSLILQQRVRNDHAEDHKNNLPRQLFGESEADGARLLIFLEDKS